MILGDVNVIGSGPNGLAAAVVLARAGLRVRVFEASDVPGGGARTTELIEPGTWHDVCSAVHPGALSSPFFQQFGLTDRVDFVVPDIAYAQPRVDRPSVLAWTDLDRTVAGLGESGSQWRRVFGFLSERLDSLVELTTDNPVLAVRRPTTALRFGMTALRQWQPIKALRALTGDAADLLSGVEAHANHPLEALSAPLTGLTLATYAHAVGWPVPVGGSKMIITALLNDLEQQGGKLHLERPVTGLGDLPPADATVFATSMRSMLDIAGPAVPDAYRRQASLFRVGAGVGKVDFVLREPVPWSDPDLGRASTVHIGGSRADLARAARCVRRGQVPEHPVVIASEPTRFDPGRAPAGRHVLWAYAQLPTRSDLDPTELLTAEIERYAPGFRDVVIDSRSMSARDLAGYNANYVGDIFAGDLSTRQVLARPIVARNPWRVGSTDLYLASSSAAPGPGVHGMGGYRAAVTALRHSFGWRQPDIRALNLAPGGGTTRHRNNVP